MRIDSLRLKGYRNVRDMEFCPGERANIVYGDNAQGKTNLLEAVWLFTGARSFRGARDSDYIAFGEDRASLFLRFQAEERAQTASIVFGGGGKAVCLNEVKQERISALAGRFCAVVFSPDHLSLIKEGPDKRRRMMDLSLCQASPKYGKALEQYEKNLRQRNRLIKDIPGHAALADTLDVWDAALIEYGAYIGHMRARYVSKIAAFAAEVYSGISRGREQFSVCYKPSFGGEAENLDKREFRERMAAAVRRNRGEDIRTGTTSIGPHRDDLEIRISGLSARSFASQGQQRSCILALKLAECRILEERWGEPPVVLLDDVMSELDENRRAYLLNQLGEKQVLITCCDVSAFSGMRDGRIFHIREGALEREE